MTIKAVRKLKNGDRVFWNDPDPESDCSRTYVIKTIEVQPGGQNSIVTIEDLDGSVLECYSRELTLITTAE